jgi:hypothetical protein
LFVFGPFEISCLSSDNSVSDLESRFEFYPNPSIDGSLEMIIRDLPNVKFKIIDFKGKQVFGPTTLYNGHSQFSLDMLPNGFYSIRLESGTTILTKKWIIIR